MRLASVTGLAIFAGALSVSSAPAVALAAPAPAQAARKAPQRSDFNGIWTGEQGVLWDTNAKPGQPQNPPFTTEYAALYKEALEAAAKGVPLADPPAACLPPGVPRIMASPFPIEIVLTPKVTYLLFEYMAQTRRAFMDKSAPERLGFPTFNGYSTGHWQGDDLVIDTDELRGDTVLDTTHVGHSDQLTVREVFHLISPTKMQVKLTLTDPKAYTTPWTVTRTYVKNSGDQILQYVCEENNRNPVMPDGTTGFIGAKD